MPVSRLSLAATAGLLLSAGPLAAPALAAANEAPAPLAAGVCSAGEERAAVAESFTLPRDEDALRECYARAAASAAGRAEAYARRAQLLADTDPAFAARYAAAGRPAEYHAVLAAQAAVRARSGDAALAAAEAAYAAKLAEHNAHCAQAEQLPSYDGAREVVGADRGIGTPGVTDTTYLRLDTLGYVDRAEERAVAEQAADGIS